MKRKPIVLERIKYQILSKRFGIRWCTKFRVLCQGCLKSFIIGAWYFNQGGGIYHNSVCQRKTQSSSTRLSPVILCTRENKGEGRPGFQVKVKCQNPKCSVLRWLSLAKVKLGKGLFCNRKCLAIFRELQEIARQSMAKRRERETIRRNFAVKSAKEILNFQPTKPYSSYLKDSIERRNGRGLEAHISANALLHVSRSKKTMQFLKKFGLPIKLSDCRSDYYSRIKEEPEGWDGYFSKEDINYNLRP